MLQTPVFRSGGEELNPILPHLVEIGLSLVVFAILFFALKKFVVPKFEEVFAEHAKGELSASELERAIDPWLQHMTWRRDFARWRERRINQEQLSSLDVLLFVGLRSHTMYWEEHSDPQINCFDDLVIALVSGRGKAPGFFRNASPTARSTRRTSRTSRPSPTA